MQGRPEVGVVPAASFRRRTVDAGIALPASKRQERKRSEKIRARLADWVATDVVPSLQHDLGQHGLPATARAEGDKVFIDYTPVASNARRARCP